MKMRTIRTAVKYRTNYGTRPPVTSLVKLRIQSSQALNLICSLIIMPLQTRVLLGWEKCGHFWAFDGNLFLIKYMHPNGDQPFNRFFRDKRHCVRYVLQIKIFQQPITTLALRVLWNLGKTSAPLHFFLVVPVISRVSFRKGFLGMVKNSWYYTGSAKYSSVYLFSLE